MKRKTSQNSPNTAEQIAGGGGSDSCLVRGMSRPQTLEDVKTHFSVALREIADEYGIGFLNDEVLSPEQQIDLYVLGPLDETNIDMKTVNERIALAKANRDELIVHIQGVLDDLNLATHLARQRRLIQSVTSAMLTLIEMRGFDVLDSFIGEGRLGDINQTLATMFGQRTAARGKYDKPAETAEKITDELRNSDVVSKFTQELVVLLKKYGS